MKIDLSGISNANRRHSDQYLQEGDFFVIIDEAKEIDTRSGPALKVMSTIVAINSGTTHQVGDQIAQMFKPAPHDAVKHQQFLDNLVTFICNVTGDPPKDATEENINRLFGEGLLNGVVCRLRGLARPYKDGRLDPLGNPKKYVLAEWGSEMSPEQIKEMIPESAIKAFKLLETN